MSACQCALGPLRECETRADCVGAQLRCVDGLCVVPTAPPLDPRCERLAGASDAGVLRFGSLMPRTRLDGGVNPTGVARQGSLLLAAEQLNLPGRIGLHGKAIELLACDTGSSAAQAGELAEHLVQHGVQAVLTSGSAETIAAAAVLVPAGVMTLSVSASAPEIASLPDAPPGTAVGSPGLVWRTAPPDSLQGRVVAAEFLDAGTPKVAVFQLNDAYGQGLGGAFSQSYPTASHRSFLFRTAGELATAVSMAEAFAPERLFIIAFPDDAARIINLAQASASLAGKRAFFSDAAKSPSLLSQVTDAGALVGAFGTAAGPVDGNSEAAKWFLPQFSQRFSVDPLSVSATGNAFDAMMCLALAAWFAGDDVSGARLAQGFTRLSAGRGVPLIPPRFSEAVTELDRAGVVDVQGVSGPLQFDNTLGEAPGPIEVWKVEGGAFVTVRVVQP